MAVDQLTKPGGYLKDKTVKILLPDEIEIKINALKSAQKILFGSLMMPLPLFLKAATYLVLMNAYKPEIDRAVQSVTIGNRSVKDLYGSFISLYNGILSKEIPTGNRTSPQLGWSK